MLFKSPFATHSRISLVEGAEEIDFTSLIQDPVKIQCSYTPQIVWQYTVLHMVRAN